MEQVQSCSKVPETNTYNQQKRNIVQG